MLVLFLLPTSVLRPATASLSAGTVRYSMFHKPVVMEKSLWVFYTLLHLQGMLCIPGDIRPRSSLLEQRKLEIFLNGMWTWIVPWSGVLEGCCHVVVWCDDGLMFGCGGWRAYCSCLELCRLFQKVVCGVFQLQYGEFVGHTWFWYCVIRRTVQNAYMLRCDMILHSNMDLCGLLFCILCGPRCMFCNYWCWGQAGGSVSVCLPACLCLSSELCIMLSAV
jgi:hypothetical protein